MEDGNRPYGLYGDVYDHSTGATRRWATTPLREFEPWEKVAIDQLLKKLNDDLHGTTNI